VAYFTCCNPACKLQRTHYCICYRFYSYTTTLYFTLSGCVESCTESEWEKYIGYTAVGASEFPGPRTIRQCMHYCEQNVNCAGVDIDVNVVPLRCWMHLSRANLSPDNVFQQQNTTHYRLIRRCPNANRTGAAFYPYYPTWSLFISSSSSQNLCILPL